MIKSDEISAPYRYLSKLKTNEKSKPLDVEENQESSLLTHRTQYNSKREQFISLSDIKLKYTYSKEKNKLKKRILPNIQHYLSNSFKNSKTDADSQDSDKYEVNSNRNFKESNYINKKQEHEKVSNNLITENTHKIIDESLESSHKECDTNLITLKDDHVVSKNSDNDKYLVYKDSDIIITDSPSLDDVPEKITISLNEENQIDSGLSSYFLHRKNGEFVELFTQYRNITDYTKNTDVISKEDNKKSSKTNEREDSSDTSISVSSAAKNENNNHFYPESANVIEEIKLVFDKPVELLNSNDSPEHVRSKLVQYQKISTKAGDQKSQKPEFQKVGDLISSNNSIMTRDLLSLDYKNKDYFSPDKVRTMMNKLDKGKVECKVCSTVTTYRAFYKHAKKHFNVKPFKCGHCQYQSIDRSKIRVHNAFCHPKDDCIILKLDPKSAKMSSIDCDESDSMFEQVDNIDHDHLIDNIILNKEDKLTPRSLKKNQRKSVFKCMFCKKELSYHTPSIKNHFYSHFRHKPYKCGHCHFTAISQGEVRSHNITHGLNTPILIEQSGAKLSENLKKLYQFYLAARDGSKNIIELNFKTRKYEDRINV